MRRRPPLGSPPWRLRRVWARCPATTTRVRRAVADRAGRAARPAAPAGAPRPRGAADHDRPGAGGDERPGCRPPAGRVAAHRCARDRPSPGAQPAGPGPRHAGGAGAEANVGSFKIQIAGPWTMAATVEKPRGDKVLSDLGPAATWPRRWPRGCAHTSRDVRRRLPGCRTAGRPGRRARAGRRADRQRPDGVRVPPAPVRPPPRGLGRPGVGARRDHRRGRRAVGAHAAPRDTPLDLLRGAGARGLSVDLAMMSAADHDVLGEALEQDETVVLGVCRAPTRPSRPPTPRSPNGCSAGWTCSASTRHDRRPAGAEPRVRAGRRDAGVGAPGLTTLRAAAKNLG